MTYNRHGKLNGFCQEVDEQGQGLGKKQEPEKTLRHKAMQFIIEFLEATAEGVEKLNTCSDRVFWSCVGIGSAVVFGLIVAVCKLAGALL